MTRYRFGEWVGPFGNDLCIARADIERLVLAGPRPDGREWPQSVLLWVAEALRWRSESFREIAVKAISHRVIEHYAEASRECSAMADSIYERIGRRA